MTALVAKLLPPEIDRRGIGVLSFGHLSVDLCQGIVPPLMPFMIVERGYSFSQAGALLLFSSLGSSLLQPLLGIFADRIRASWLVPAGAVTAAVGSGASGVADSYAGTAVCLMVASVGVAMFHPEAVRFASYVSARSGRQGTGMSFFALGGMSGWAIGPILVTGSVLAFGLSGTVLVAILPLIAAVVLVTERRHLDSFRPDAATRADAGDGPSQWGVFSLAAAAAMTRTGMQFGLQAFVPLYVWQTLETSEAIGNAAGSTLMIAGAVGTLVGGRLADRLGFRSVVVRSIAITVPLVALITVSPLAGVFVLMVLIGISMEGSFYPLVVLAQNAVPRHVGFASGVILGLSIGVGAATAALLGVLADASGLERTVQVLALVAGAAWVLASLLPKDDRS